MPILYTDPAGIDIINEELSSDVWVWPKPHIYHKSIPLYVDDKDIENPIQTDGYGNLCLSIDVCHTSFSNKNLYIYK